MKQKQRIILFDGVCNLCNSAVDLILKKAQDNDFKFVALQSEEGQGILKKFDLQLQIDSVLLIQNNKLFSESDAVLEICKHLKAPWSWLTAFKLIPKSWRDNLYRFVANKRYKWFGKRSSCRSF
ncbi:DCC1-like thiol-disulfide oxidoreductase family protein [uncultured Draconibacterium sp.]|uniref:thiol-disulfide oxidoreductase DCC family protein n=1 Tax=uncultured Draconibacterium sp. TaxID=1573823 RepID=UPI002AA74B7F|nr:DCC1-like thiol-disulfide oxidoreductase family protein [uncultured Draconibacterium sp.]